MIDIQPNGKERPTGTGPSGSYFLMVRRNGRGYYTRWFHADEAARGTRRDLATPTLGLKPDDRLTVAVENINPLDSSDSVRLSNILELPMPPSSAPSFAIPSPNATQ